MCDVRVSFQEMFFVYSQSCKLQQPLYIYIYIYIYIHIYIYTYIHTYKKSYSACLFTRPEFKSFRHWVSYQSCCHWSLAQTEARSSALARQKAKASICVYLKRNKYRHWKNGVYIYTHIIYIYIFYVYIYSMWIFMYIQIYSKEYAYIYLYIYI